MGVEVALLEVLRAGTERIHQVATDRGVALDFAGQDGLHVGEDTVEHLRDGDQGTFEELEIAGGVCEVGGHGI